MLSDDPLWPRASAWLEGGAAGESAALAVVGLPTSVGSISPSQAWRTPPAFREVLARFSPFDGEAGVDLADLAVADLGDLDLAAADLEGMLATVEAYVAGLQSGPVYAFVGGDNAVTRATVGGLAAGDLSSLGVLTFDAHHDVRTLDDGPRNGTPIRGLVEDGLPGRNVIQIGIHSFANSAVYRRWCDEHGISVRTMADVHEAGVEAVTLAALADLADRCNRIYIDFDIDVLDRAFAPGCPGSRPGGMTPRQLAAAARLCGAHPAVTAADFVEVDPAADRDDLTLMSLATTFLAFASGVGAREVAT